MTQQSAEQRIRKLCRDALVKVRGDTSKAYEVFNNSILECNDALLERELTQGYRSTALRAWIAETYQQLRAEGKIPTNPKDIQIRTTNYTEPRNSERKPTWAAQHIETRKKRIEKEAQQYEDRLLETFRINGQPIGDCTAEEVLSRADFNEKDARFMRLMASGVPAQGKIRDYVTPVEAKERWKQAEKEPERIGLLDLWDNERYKRLSKSIKSEEQYEIALKEAESLMDAKPRTIEGLWLDMLANRIKDWEDYSLR